MASCEVVVISSSPPKGRQLTSAPSTPPSIQRRASMPPFSSDGPSPPSGFDRRPTGALKSGSWAVPVPKGAIAGFATAASLVRDRVLSLEPDDISMPQKPRTSSKATSNKPSKPRNKFTEPSTKIAATKDGKSETKKRRQGNGRVTALAVDKDTLKTHHSLSEAVDQSTLDSFPDPNPAENNADLQAKPKNSTSRKPRAKKDTAKETMAQTIQKSGKSAKSRSDEKALEKKGTTKKNTKRKTTGPVSSHFIGPGFEGGYDIYTGEETTSIGEKPLQKVKKVKKVGKPSSVAPVNEDIWNVPTSPKDAQPSSRNSAKQDPKELEDTTLAIDEAISRRKDWTPIKDTNFADSFMVSTAKENDPPVQNHKDAQFTNMLSNFTYAQHVEAQSTCDLPPDSNVGATKRRRIELVDMPTNQSNSRSVSPEKGKAPKKKARTITDLVTGQYAPKDPPAKLQHEANQFFSTHNTTIPLNDKGVSGYEEASETMKMQTDRTTTSEKRKSRSKKANTRTAAKPKLVVSKLLSPASAALRLNKQEILFGTSSQLAREESPTFIRQVQTAIRESEADVDAFVDVGGASGGCISSLIKPTRRLWSASARDLDDGFLEKDDAVFAKVVDYGNDLARLIDGAGEEKCFVEIDDSRPSKQNSPPLLISNSAIEATDAETSIQPDPHELSFQDIDTFGPTPLQSHQDVSFQDIDAFSIPPRSHQSSAFKDNQKSNSDGQRTDQYEADFEDIDNFLPITRLNANCTVPHRKESSSAPPPKLASDGSPKKRRGRPPKSHSATSSTAPTAKKPRKSPAKSPPLTPKKKPRKFEHVDEIQDSEDDSGLSPTPPRCYPTQPAPLQLSPNTGNAVVAQVHRIPALKLAWENVRPFIFTQINNLIQKIPPSKDHANPTWHEKILLYDPIILEDLTAWVNQHASVRTYARATQKQIKKSKEVYGTSDEGLKFMGKAAAENGAMVEDGVEVVDAVEKELEIWMVQKWCEERSICCVLREKIGGGRVRGTAY